MKTLKSMRKWENKTYICLVIFVMAASCTPNRRTHTSFVQSDGKDIIIEYVDDTIFINGEMSFIYAEGEYYTFIKEQNGKIYKWSLCLSSLRDTSFIVPRHVLFPAGIDYKVVIKREKDNLYSTTRYLINSYDITQPYTFFLYKCLYDKDYNIIEYTHVKSVELLPE